MSDITYNRHQIWGTDAQRIAFTPDPGDQSVVGPGVSNGVIWVVSDVANNPTYAWDFGGAAWVQIAGGGGTGTVTNTGTLTDHALIVGNGGVDVSALASLGTTTTLLHGNAAGDPTFGAVVTADITDAQVTLAKIADAASNDMLLGSGNSGSGAPYEEITLGTNLSMSGTTLNATGGGSTSPFIATGRLTTESGVPISTSDRTAQSTIYYTPYLGAQIALYDGANWAVSSFTERSLALSSLTSGKNYDVFLYDNTGTLTLELSAAWASDTTRTDAIVLQDGVYVKSGATTRRLLGTIRTTSTTTTADASNNRFVWNVTNRVLRYAARLYATTYSYATNTWRETNGVTTERIEFVLGLVGDAVYFFASTIVEQNSGTPEGFISLAIDSTTAPDTNATIDKVRLPSFQYQGIQTLLTATVGIGYHYATMLEKANNGTVNMNNDGSHVLGGAIVA